MSLSSYDNLLLETPAFQSPTSVRTIKVGRADWGSQGEYVLPTTSADSGGGAYLVVSEDSAATRVLLWEFSAQEASALHLTEAAYGCELTHNAIRIVFPSALFPQAAFAQQPNGSHVHVLTAQGVLYRVQLPLSSQGRPEESVLNSLRGANGGTAGSASIQQVPLRGWLERLGTPTSLAVVDGTVAIGSEHGGVICIPEEAFASGIPDGAFELRDTRGVLSSFFSRATSSAVSDLTSMKVAGQTLLAAVYADSTLRVWDVASQKRLLTAPLLQEAPFQGITPQRLRFGPQQDQERDVSMMVQFHASEGTSADWSSVAPQVAMYSLVASQAVGGALTLSLEPVGKGISSIEGRIQDIAACQDATWGRYLWVLGGGMRPQLSALTEIGGQGLAAVLCSDVVQHMLAAGPKDPRLQEDLWAVVKGNQESSGNPLPVDQVTRYLLGHLLVPGHFSPDALADTLEQLGKPIDSAQLRGKSASQILEFVIEVLHQQEDGAGELEAVQHLLSTYWKAWDSLYPPYALLQHPVSGEVSVVRGGPSLLLLRKTTPAESLVHDNLLDGITLDNVLDNGARDMILQQVPLAMERILLASEAVDTLLGRLIGEATLACNCGQEGGYMAAVVPALVEALAAGPQEEPHPATVGFAASMTPGSGRREANNVWRKKRRQTTAPLGMLLAEVPQLAQAAESVLREIAEPPHLPFYNARGWQQDANVAAYRQAAAAQIAVSRALLTLIGYISQAQVLGAWVAPPEELHRLQNDIAPEAEVLLQRAKILHWLTVTPASTAPGDASDPTALLLELRLGGSQGSKNPSVQSRHQTSVQERLLASMFPATVREVAEHPDVDFVSLESLASQAAGTSSSETLLQQTLEVASVLFAKQQMAALGTLLTLVSLPSTNPAMQFLQGIVSVSRLRQARDASERAEVVQEALGPLFQAAAGLRPRAAHVADRRREDDLSVSWLRRMLSQLLQEMMGAAAEEAPEAEELRYYEVLMLLCERLGSPVGAARFAQAAAHQAALLRAENRLQGQDLSAREGRLWTNLFFYALDARSYQEAYVALEANPLPERRLEGLKHLIHILCEAGQLATLVSFPYASSAVVQRAEREVTVSLLEEAIQILQRRAGNAELDARPQPYQVLYDFCATRGDWRRAAEAQLALSRRLRDEGTPSAGLAHQYSLALGAAANALSLVDAQHAWLEDPSPRAAAEPDTSTPMLTAPASSLEAAPPAAAPEERGVGKVTLTLQDLIRESRAAAAQARWLSEAPLGSPADIVKQLHAAGRYEAAIELADAVLEAPPQSSAIQKGLASMAAACAAQQAGRALPPGRQPDAEMFTGVSGGSSCWDRLELLVERFSGEVYAVQLWTRVAEAILGADSRLKLPAWLRAHFLRGDRRQGMAGGPGNPTALLQLYMSYNRQEDAANLAISYLHSWLHEVSDLDRQRSAGAWFPYALLNSLQAVLGASQDPRLRKLGVELAGQRQQLSQLAVQQTEILEQRMQHQHKGAQAINTLQGGSSFGLSVVS